MTKKQIFVCQGRWCTELGSPRILERLKQHFSSENDTVVSGCKCADYCEQGVNIVIDSDTVIHDVTEENLFDTLNDTSTHRPFRRESIVEIKDDFLGDL